MVSFVIHCCPLTTEYRTVCDIFTGKTLLYSSVTKTSQNTAGYQQIWYTVVYVEFVVPFIKIDNGFWLTVNRLVNGNSTFPKV